MHELSLCNSIADTVRENTEGRTVETVHLKIGYLRQVVPDTLLFCWGFITDNSDLAGSELLIEHVPARVQCHECGAETEIDRPIMVCESCGGASVRLISGDEFLIEYIDVESLDVESLDVESPEEVH